jgi:hypothetical protein
MVVGFLVSLFEPAPPPEKLDGRTWGGGSTAERKPVESPA